LCAHNVPTSMPVPMAANHPAKGSSDRVTRSARLQLTDRHLRALKPSAHARDYHDTQQRGLIARILPSCIVQFSVRYRYQGKQRRLKLGEYPAVSLQEARKRARNAQSKVDNGADPDGERHAAKAERTDTGDA